MYTSTVPAKVVIQHQCLHLWDNRHDLGELSVADFGKHVHCGKFPHLEELCCDLRMETSFCGHWLIGSGSGADCNAHT